MNALHVTPQPASGLRGRLGTFVVMVVLAASIAAVAWYVDQPTAGAGTSAEAAWAAASPPKAGEPAPDFGATTVDGEQIRLSDYRGKPLWLTFGASWCADCRAEALDLEATYEQFKPQGLVVLGIFKWEGAQAVRDYAGRVGFTFTMVADPRGAISDLYHNLGLPTHLLITPDGVIREVRLGRLSAEEMARLVATVME
jgi:peroxiredoxin